jgi:GT2 family glycosyltransferase/glycosyltransferase involved in cell wall biosynthesis
MTNNSGNTTNLVQGNQSMRARDYQAAVIYYVRALRENPAMVGTIAPSLAIVRKKYRTGRHAAPKPRAAVCGLSLGDGVEAYLNTLALIYQNFADVEIIDKTAESLRPKPSIVAARSRIERRSFSIDKQTAFLPQAINIVLAQPYDIVHLCKPTASNILLGVLFKLIWDARILIDVDHDEPLTDDLNLSLVSGEGSFNTWLENFSGRDWLSISQRLSLGFSAMAVASEQLHLEDPAAPSIQGGEENSSELSQLAGSSIQREISKLADPAKNNSITIGQLTLLADDTKILDFMRGDRTRVGDKPYQSATPQVDIVVPVYNALQDVQRCLESLARCTDDLLVRVIVVNDGSDLPTSDWLRKYCGTKANFQLIEQPHNSGYTKAVNVGLRAATAAYVITQNSDTIVTAGWLTGMVRCMKSNPKLGIVGPLSNAASWQNVPDLYDEQGAFAVNELPGDMSPGGMAVVVAQASQRSYPRTPFINGFCFMISRDALSAVGYMDEENFPIGFGEENDFCIRAANAGFELAIADDVYVFHAKSKSFGHERRKELSKQGSDNLKRKHSPAKFKDLVDRVKITTAMDVVRQRVRKAIGGRSNSTSSANLIDMNVLFLLPVKGGGGGVHSIVQEVTEMRRLGLNAHIGVKKEHVGGFLENYADIINAADLFVGFDNDSLMNIVEDYDVVVGTIFSSMALVKRIVDINPHILPAYYVQDYEPMFFESGSDNWQLAIDSYTLVPNALLFAKTHWIARTVFDAHGVAVAKVSPSIDHEVYKPVRRKEEKCINVAAMIRPQTPRRGAERTMRVLSRLHHEHLGNISIHVFGCAEESFEFQALQRDFPYINHGSLKRPQVAALLANSDLFIDLSDYQAFGRTALEAMACGCAAVVPKVGGADEYAVHNDNTLMVDTLDEDHCFTLISQTLASTSVLRKLQVSGLLTASGYSVHKAAVSECVQIKEALENHRKINNKVIKKNLILIPARRPDGLPTDTGYRRIVLPYGSDAMLKDWRVEISDRLPEPVFAGTAVIQSDSASFSLADLKLWFDRWKTAGGRVVYEVGDDVMPGLGPESVVATKYASAKSDVLGYLASHADVVTVASESRAAQYRLLNACVRVVPNALDHDLWQLAKSRDHFKGEFARKPDGPVRIGIMGDHTQDCDLSQIIPALMNLREKYKEKIEIEWIGKFSENFQQTGKLIPFPKKNDYPNFVNWLFRRVHWDIVLIPAESNQDSSGGFRILECAALDTAIVVSRAVDDSSGAISAGNYLRVNDKKGEWLSAISHLLEDVASRQRFASMAKSDIEHRRVVKSEVFDICSALK